jgi:hypothetical protein
MCIADWSQKDKVIRVQETSTSKWMWARGLTKVLNSSFYPDFYPKLECERKSNVGKKTGILVDKQAALIIEKKSRLRKTHPMIEKLYTEFTRRDLTPIRSQFPVGCAHIRVGTKIDIICENNKKEIVIVELKCGFEEYHTKCNQDKMKSPYSELSQCCRNSHMLQLLYTTWLFHHCEHELSDRPLGIPLLIVINSDVCVEELPPYLCNMSVKSGIRVMNETRYQTEKTRKKIIYNGKRRRKRKKDKQVEQEDESPVTTTYKRSKTKAKVFL